MQARWYQVEAIERLFRYFETNNGNPLLAIPTGAGKSFIIADFLRQVFALFPNQRILVGTHVKELIAQNHEAVRQVWPDAPAGIYSAGLNRRDIFQPITFGGVKSLLNVIGAFGHIDLFIIDEAHLLGTAADGMYMQIIAALREVNPYLKVIGLTATAWRTGLGLLTNGDIFTDIAYDLCNIDGFKRLFSDGYLVPPRPKRVDNEIDFSGVSVSNGEYSQSGMQEVTRKLEVSWQAMQESIGKNPDRMCRLVFCTGVDHAIACADMGKALGFRSEAVHSKMSNGARDDVMTAFKAGEIDLLTNNGICTTGINHPPIDHIIGLRATMSVGLWCQIMGRGTRPFEIDGYRKTDCIVSDHAGNARRLGPIDDPYIPKMKGKSAGNMPVKICNACDSYNHTSARVCVYCGEPFATKVGFQQTAHDDILVRSDLPITETFRVDHVYYTQHLRRDADPTTKPTLKATYRCGLQQFIEFVPFESKYAHKAREWWRQRFPAEGFVPTTVNEAMQYVDRLIPPKAIKVWVNKKYPEIIGCEY